jgi:G8 domain
MSFMTRMMKLDNNKISSFIFCSAILYALQGCGGGGGSQNDVAVSQATASQSTITPSGTTGTIPVASTNTGIPTGTSGGQPPTTPQIDIAMWNGKDVVIQTGTVATLDADVSPKTLTVYGTLRCAADRDLSISAKWIIVDGGLLECGEEKSPFTKNLTITLQGEPSEESVVRVGTKVLGAVNGGQINLIGKARANWVQLAANATAGTNQLLLTQPVDWLPGDRIVIASSVVTDQSEERVIESVSSSSVKLKTPLTFSHTGEIRRVANTDIDLRAEVGLLTHSIRIQGDEASVASKFGGHVMISGKNSNARIQGVQFTRMGQFNRLGRYPMHWHHVRNAQTGYFKNNSISDTFQRGLIVHATDNLLIEKNVVFNTQGHSYGLENGSETGNVFSRNLGLGTHGALMPKVTFEDGTPADDDQAATFWFVGGNNTFIGNVAAGSDHSGFWFERSGDVKLFSGNTAHSNAVGDRPGTNDQGGLTTKDSNGMSGVLENMLLYSNGVGAWFQAGKVTLSNSKLVDNKMATFSNLSLENSIVIGDSKGQQGSNEGIVTYNSPVIAKNVTFANFNGYAMRTFLGGPEGATFTTQGLKFINVDDTKRIMLQVGNAYAQDIDGSLVGRPAVLTSDEPSMYTPECTAKPTWSVHVCPPTPYKYQIAFLGESSKGDTLTRDDGVKQSLGLNVPFFNVIAGRKYTMNRDQGSFNVWVDGANGFVEIITPSANGRFDIFECAFVGNCTDETRKLSPATNQAELDQSNGDRYFYDSVAGQLHLKVGRWRQIVVRRL